MSLVLLGFLLKVERVSGCELLLQQTVSKEGHPSSEASEEKKMFFPIFPPQPDPSDMNKI